MCLHQSMSGVLFTTVYITVISIALKDFYVLFVKLLKSLDLCSLLQQATKMNKWK